jgi:hypothetical protein
VTNSNGFWIRRLDLLALLYNYNQLHSSQSMAAYDSLHSLLDYECLLFCCDECRTKNLSRMNSAKRSHVSSLYNFVRPEERPPFPTVIACLFVVMETSVATCYLATEILPLDCVTFERLPKRCLAMVYSVTISSVFNLGASSPTRQFV